MRRPSCYRIWYPAHPNNLPRRVRQRPGTRCGWRASTAPSSSPERVRPSPARTSTGPRRGRLVRRCAAARATAGTASRCPPPQRRPRVAVSFDGSSGVPSARWQNTIDSGARCRLAGNCSSSASPRPGRAGSSSSRSALRRRHLAGRTPAGHARADRAARRRRRRPTRLLRLPRPTTGPGSGRRTRSSGSTARSAAAPTSSGSSETIAPLIRLAASVVIEQNDEWLVGKRYLSQHTLDAILTDDEKDNSRKETPELAAA